MQATNTASHVPDARWAAIAPLLPEEAPKPKGGRPRIQDRGAVEFASRQTFHGVLLESQPRTDNPAFSEMTGKALDPVKVYTAFEQWLLSVTNGRCIFMSDNPECDFQRINYGFHHAIGPESVRPLGTPHQRLLRRPRSEISATARPGRGSASLSTITTQSMTRWETSKPLHEC